jgi:pilus assembly protein CpaE
MASPASADPFAPPGGRRIPTPIYIYVDDQGTANQVEAELGPATGEAINVYEGGLAQALSVSEWPPALGGLLVDISSAHSATADLAALLSVLPRGCVVVAVGDTNDVSLFRDLTAIGIADYLVKPFRHGALIEAFERGAATKVREATLARANATMAAAASGATSAQGEKPRVISVIGSRGGTGATTISISIAALIAQRLSKEVLLVDLDLHFGSLMLALDLEASDALSEALMQPDRIDNFFIDQAVQKKGDHLRVLAAEEPPQAALNYHPGAIDRLLDELQKRFGWIVVDLPRADTAVQRHVLQVSTDLVILCDMSLPGVRDAMRLQQVVQEFNSEAKVHIASSGSSDPRRAPVKVADLERSLKRRVDVQIPHDDKSAAAAVNSGKPLPEVAPTSSIVRALGPLVTTLIGDAAKRGNRSFFGRLLGRT